MATPLETPVSRRLASVKNIIIVLSGKGGVGKSSSSVQLALSLLNTSPTTRVGLLDLDITGPSLPRMVGLDLPGASVHQSSSGWVPVYVDQGRRLGVMSIGFLLKDRGDSVVWRGPKKDGMIRQFLSEVRWGDLDYLVIDTPPGESDSSTATDVRNIGRTHFLINPSPSPLYTYNSTTHDSLQYSHHHPSNHRFERYRQISFFHQETRSSRHWSSGEYGRVRLSVLR